VKKHDTHIKELAALYALGTLDGEDARAFSALLAENAEAQQEAKAFSGVAEALAGSLPSAPLPAGLKNRILRQIKARQARAQAQVQMSQLVPPAKGGLAFLKDAAGPGWMPLSVPGASVKLLSFDPNSAYAVVLGKLEPGSRYPDHTHQCPEDIYMLSGDLHVGDTVIRAGDFHHAEAGSQHPVNWSETGCVLLCVLSKDDLLAQLSR
jgi:anti-sigma factor ChrR (cupin superfamily)